MSRIREAIAPTTPWVKFYLACATLTAGVALHLMDSEEHGAGAGVKAAAFALLAGGMLVGALVPVRQREARTRVVAGIDFFVQFVVAFAAVSAGAYWIIEEVDGEFPLAMYMLLWAVVLIAGGGIGGSLIIAAANIFNEPPAKPDLEKVRAALEQEVLDDHARFMDSLTSDETRTQELADHALVMEIILANLLLAMRYEQVPLREDTFNGIFRMFEERSDRDRPGITGTAARIKNLVGLAILNSKRSPPD